VRAAGSSPPWRNDHPWNPAGEGGALERRARRLLWWGAAVAAVLLPWNALAAVRPDLLPPALAAVADLAPAALLARGAWLRRAWRRDGAARLRFDRFPFFLGEPFEVVLALGRRASRAGAVEVTLACLEQRLDDLAGDEAAWREVEVYRAAQVILAAPETAVTFELPAADRGLGTELGTPESRRWELRARGRAGAPVDAVFPVPVYAPPPDAGDEAG
jgi:hypothetical protein